MRPSVWISTLILLFGGAHLQAQDSRPDFEGMWSDPPNVAVDAFCFVFCTEVGVDYLNALLDDPDNDDRSFGELSREATGHQLQEYLRPRLTAAALETFPLDPADDPGFLECQPWGFAKQVFAPHQMEIRQYDDRVDILYGEWEARRTVYLDRREPPENQPPSMMGHSVGRYEGEILVIETSGIRANITFWRAEHSDQLRVVKRYVLSEDGDRLEVLVTMEDPWGLQDPLQLKKIWSWAPNEEIFPYVDCELPSEFTGGWGSHETNTSGISSSAPILAVQPCGQLAPCNVACVRCDRGDHDRRHRHGVQTGKPACDDHHGCVG